MEQDAFKLGVQAARAGDFETAQQYFRQVVQANPRSEKGWLYLGHCLTDREKRISCYQRVLRLNPDNQEARKTLASLGQPYLRPQEKTQQSYPYYYQPEPVRAEPAPPAWAAKSKKSRFSTTMLIIGSAVGLIVCLGVVCIAITMINPKAQALPTSTPIPTPSLPALDASILPAPVASAGPGKICLGFWDQGVACLDENGWQTYNTSNSELPADYVTAGIFCPDGRLALAHAEGISLIRDQQWEHIPKIGEGIGIVKSLACDKDGHLWAAHPKGVSHYVDGAWQTYYVGLLAIGQLPNEDVSKVLITPDGKVWALTSLSVAMFADNNWTIFQKGQGLPDTPSALTFDAAGRPWVWYGSGAAVYDNGSWKLFTASAPIAASFFSPDARGWFWLGAFDMGLASFDGKTWSSYNQKTANLTNDKIYDLATDSLGRVWVATVYGLSVFDGSNWQTYRMDNADLLDNRIGFIAVERDGPNFPPPVDKKKGFVTGKLPFGNKRVEVCIAYKDDFNKGPSCDEQLFFLSTYTDAQGYFYLDNVPTGYYYLLGETNNGWANLVNKTGFGKRILVKPGEQYDVGELELIEGK